jgi:spore germination cell wall hydrolase CwlJ-like protein
MRGQPNTSRVNTIADRLNLVVIAAILSFIFIGDLKNESSIKVFNEAHTTQVAETKLPVVEAPTNPSHTSQYTPTVKLVKVDNNDLKCMASAIFYEARGADFFEKQRVANVIKNRANNSNFPSTICKVVNEYKQFSFTLNPINDYKRIKFLAATNILEKQAWMDCLFVAHKVLASELVDNTHGAVYYHTNEIKPKWNFKKLAQTTQSKWHRYYRERS